MMAVFIKEHPVLAGLAVATAYALVVLILHVIFRPKGIASKHDPHATAFGDVPHFDGRFLP